MRRSSHHHRQPATIEYLSNLLDQIDPDICYSEWIQVLMAVCHETGASEEGFYLVDAWSSHGHKYKGTKDVHKHWKYLKPDHPKPYTIATLYRMAKSNR